LCHRPALRAVLGAGRQPCCERLPFRIQSVFLVPGFGFRVSSSGSRISGFRFRLLSLELRVLGLGCGSRVSREGSPIASERGRVRVDELSASVQRTW